MSKTRTQHDIEIAQASLNMALEMLRNKNKIGALDELSRVRNYVDEAMELLDRDVRRKARELRICGSCGAPFRPFAQELNCSDCVDVSKAERAAWGRPENA